TAILCIMPKVWLTPIIASSNSPPFPADTTRILSPKILLFKRREVLLFTSASNSDTLVYH
ncbi:putative oxidative stress defense protein, partial [Candidatus Termititenax aidoneus]